VHGASATLQDCHITLSDHGFRSIYMFRILQACLGCQLRSLVLDVRGVPVGWQVGSLATEWARFAHVDMKVDGASYTWDGTQRHLCLCLLPGLRRHQAIQHPVCMLRDTLRGITIDLLALKPTEIPFPTGLALRVTGGRPSPVLLYVTTSLRPRTVDHVVVLVNAHREAIPPELLAQMHACMHACI
jgi:hypothetical protein